MTALEGLKQDLKDVRRRIYFTIQKETKATLETIDKNYDMGLITFEEVLSQKSEVAQAHLRNADIKAHKDY